MIGRSVPLNATHIFGLVVVNSAWPPNWAIDRKRHSSIDLRWTLPVEASNLTNCGELWAASLGLFLFSHVRPETFTGTSTPSCLYVVLPEKRQDALYVQLADGNILSS